MKVVAVVVVAKSCKLQTASEARSASGVGGIFYDVEWK